MNPEAMDRFIHSILTAFEEGDPHTDEKAVEKMNVQLLKSIYTALAMRDLNGFTQPMSPAMEMEIIAPPELPFSGYWKGREHVIQATLKNFSLLEDQHPEVLSVVAQGDTVIVFAKERGRIKATQKEYEIHWMQRFTFQNGSLIKMTELADTSGILDAFRAE